MLNQNNDDFLTKQLITYIGNKRKLLPYIEEALMEIKSQLNKEKLDLIDLFSGSGIVARLFKKHANLLIVNDLEYYSYIINRCYLTNPSEFDFIRYEQAFSIVKEKLKDISVHGIISNHYAPKDEHSITKEDRVFFTKKNAVKIDSLRKVIEDIDKDLQCYFLAPLLYQASVHNNTGGVFKGFYKDSNTGIGKFGGNGENALKRIKGEITLKKPIFSPYECKVDIYQEDSNHLVKKLDKVDVVYIDPPYNQHPYGSNYFMLNVIAKNRLDDDISKISGIPKNWNRSQYNKKPLALKAFNDLINDVKSNYILVSYNSEGFISYDEIVEVLSRYGEVTVNRMKYHTYKASRNLSERSKYVNEYLFILKKRS